MNKVRLSFLVLFFALVILGISAISQADSVNDVFLNVDIGYVNSVNPGQGLVFDFEPDMMVSGTQPEDSRMIGLMRTRNYDVYGLSLRGDDGYHERDENYYIEINGQTGPISEDDELPNEISERVDFLGNFEMNGGENEIIMRSAGDDSVSLDKICVIISESDNPLGGEARLHDEQTIIELCEEADEIVTDITDDIYVGDSSEKYATQHAVIPLTENGVAIEDMYIDGDVAGLHVHRGSDEFGNYFAFTQWNDDAPDNVAKEMIEFSMSLTNGVVAYYSNGSPEGVNPYEDPETGTCGIDKVNPVNSRPGDDEYSLAINESEADFCSTVGSGIDRVRIYYEYFEEIEPPEGDLEITDVTTNPSLPLDNEGESVDIYVDFTSNKYPIEVNFELFDEYSNLEATQGPIILNGADDLPIIYVFPAGLNDGGYDLWMNVEDGDNNQVSIHLGQINVQNDDNEEGEENDDEHDNGGVAGKLKFVSSYEPPKEGPVVPAPYVLNEDYLDATEEKSNVNPLVVWIWILVILIIVLLVLIVIAGFA